MMKKGTISWRTICLCVLGAFTGTMLLSDAIRVKHTQASVMGLPAPAALVRVSEDYSMPELKGIKLDPEDPLKINFVIDSRDRSKVVKKDADRLISYFLAGLAMPDDQIWVNLSPYESERIVPQPLAQTDLGRDLLAQDYIIKQLASSLTHPDTELGKQYWNNAGAGLSRPDGAQTAPLQNTFNKIWITPDSATVHEENGLAIITDATLKVMTERDYVAMQASLTEGEYTDSSLQDSSTDLLLPSISQDVNKGRNFAPLRQIYHALILATWFKKKFAESFYRYYIDQKSTETLAIEDKQMHQKIYALYLKAFESGTYDVIRSGIENSAEKEKRRYFSGGFDYQHRQLDIYEGITEETGNSAIEGEDAYIAEVSLANVDLSGPGADSADLEAIFKTILDVDAVIADLDINQNKKTMRIRASKKKNKRSKKVKEKGAESRLKKIAALEQNLKELQELAEEAATAELPESTKENIRQLYAKAELSRAVESIILNRTQKSLELQSRNVDLKDLIALANGQELPAKVSQPGDNSAPVSIEVKRYEEKLQNMRSSPRAAALLAADIRKFTLELQQNQRHINLLEQVDRLDTISAITDSEEMVVALYEKLLNNNKVMKSAPESKKKKTIIQNSVTNFFIQHLIQQYSAYSVSVPYGHRHSFEYFATVYAADNIDFYGIRDAISSVVPGISEDDLIDITAGAFNMAANRFVKYQKTRYSGVRAAVCGLATGAVFVFGLFASACSNFFGTGENVSASDTVVMTDYELKPTTQTDGDFKKKIEPDKDLPKRITIDDNTPIYLKKREFKKTSEGEKAENNYYRIGIRDGEIFFSRHEISAKERLRYLQVFNDDALRQKLLLKLQEEHGDITLGAMIEDEIAVVFYHPLDKTKTNIVVLDPLKTTSEALRRIPRGKRGRGGIVYSVDKNGQLLAHNGNFVQLVGPRRVLDNPLGEQAIYVFSTVDEKGLVDNYRILDGKKFFEIGRTYNDEAGEVLAVVIDLDEKVADIGSKIFPDLEKSDAKARKKRLKQFNSIKRFFGIKKEMETKRFVKDFTSSRDLPAATGWSINMGKVHAKIDIAEFDKYARNSSAEDDFTDVTEQSGENKTWHRNSGAVIDLTYDLYLELRINKKGDLEVAGARGIDEFGREVATYYAYHQPGSRQGFSGRVSFQSYFGDTSSYTFEFKGSKLEPVLTNDGFLGRGARIKSMFQDFGNNPVYENDDVGRRRTSYATYSKVGDAVIEAVPMPDGNTYMGSYENDGRQTFGWKAHVGKKLDLHDPAQKQAAFAHITLRLLELEQEKESYENELDFFPGRFIQGLTVLQNIMKKHFKELPEAGRTDVNKTPAFRFLVKTISFFDALNAGEYDSSDIVRIAETLLTQADKFKLNTQYSAQVNKLVEEYNNMAGIPIPAAGKVVIENGQYMLNGEVFVPNEITTRSLTKEAVDDAVVAGKNVLRTYELCWDIELINYAIARGIRLAMGADYLGDIMTGKVYEWARIFGNHPGVLSLDEGNEYLKRSSQEWFASGDTSWIAVIRQTSRAIFEINPYLIQRCPEYNEATEGLKKFISDVPYIRVWGVNIYERPEFIKHKIEQLQDHAGKSKKVVISESGYDSDFKALNALGLEEKERMKLGEYVQAMGYHNMFIGIGHDKAIATMGTREDWSKAGSADVRDSISSEEHITNKNPIVENDTFSEDEYAPFYADGTPKEVVPVMRAHALVTAALTQGLIKPDDAFMQQVRATLFPVPQNGQLDITAMDLKAAFDSSCGKFIKLVNTKFPDKKVQEKILRKSYFTDEQIRAAVNATQNRLRANQRLKLVKRQIENNQQILRAINDGTTDSVIIKVEGGTLSVSTLLTPSETIAAYEDYEEVLGLLSESVKPHLNDKKSIHANLFDILYKLEKDTTAVSDTVPAGFSLGFNDYRIKGSDDNRIYVQYNKEDDQWQFNLAWDRENNHPTHAVKVKITESIQKDPQTGRDKKVKKAHIIKEIIMGDPREVKKHGPITAGNPPDFKTITVADMKKSLGEAADQIDIGIRKATARYSDNETGMNQWLLNAGIIDSDRLPVLNERNFLSDTDEKGETRYSTDYIDVIVYQTPGDPLGRALIKIKPFGDRGSYTYEIPLIGVKLVERDAAGRIKGFKDCPPALTPISLALNYNMRGQFDYASVATFNRRVSLQEEFDRDIKKGVAGMGRDVPDQYYEGFGYEFTLHNSKLKKSAVFSASGQLLRETFPNALQEPLRRAGNMAIELGDKHVYYQDRNGKPYPIAGITELPLTGSERLLMQLDEIHAWGEYEGRQYVLTRPHKERLSSLADGTYNRVELYDPETGKQLDLSDEQRGRAVIKYLSNIDYRVKFKSRNQKPSLLERMKWWDYKTRATMLVTSYARDPVNPVKMADIETGFVNDAVLGTKQVDYPDDKFVEAFQWLADKTAGIPLLGKATARLNMYRKILSSDQKIQSATDFELGVRFGLNILFVFFFFVTVPFAATFKFWLNLKAFLKRRETYYSGNEIRNGTKVSYKNDYVPLYTADEIRQMISAARSVPLYGYNIDSVELAREAAIRDILTLSVNGDNHGQGLEKFINRQFFEEYRRWAKLVAGDEQEANRSLTVSDMTLFNILHRSAEIFASTTPELLFFEFYALNAYFINDDTRSVAQVTDLLRRFHAGFSTYIRANELPLGEKASRYGLTAYMKKNREYFWSRYIQDDMATDLRNPQRVKGFLDFLDLYAEDLLSDEGYQNLRKNAANRNRDVLMKDYKKWVKNNMYDAEEAYRKHTEADLDALWALRSHDDFYLTSDNGLLFAEFYIFKKSYRQGSLPVDNIAVAAEAFHEDMKGYLGLDRIDDPLLLPAYFNNFAAELTAAPGVVAYLDKYIRFVNGQFVADHSFDVIKNAAGQVFLVQDNSRSGTASSALGGLDDTRQLSFEIDGSRTSSALGSISKAELKGMYVRGMIDDLEVRSHFSENFGNRILNGVLDLNLSKSHGFTRQNFIDVVNGNLDFGLNDTEKYFLGEMYRKGLIFTDNAGNVKSLQQSLIDKITEYRDLEKYDMSHDKRLELLNGENYDDAVKLGQKLAFMRDEHDFLAGFLQLIKKDWQSLYSLINDNNLLDTETLAALLQGIAKEKRNDLFVISVSRGRNGNDIEKFSLNNRVLQELLQKIASQPELAEEYARLADEAEKTEFLDPEHAVVRKTARSAAAQFNYNRVIRTIESGDLTTAMRFVKKTRNNRLSDDMHYIAQQYNAKLADEFVAMKRGNPDSAALYDRAAGTAQRSNEVVRIINRARKMTDKYIQPAINTLTRTLKHDIKRMRREKDYFRTGGRQLKDVEDEVNRLFSLETGVRNGECPAHWAAQRYYKFDKNDKAQFVNKAQQGIFAGDNDIIDTLWHYYQKFDFNLSYNENLELLLKKSNDPGINFRMKNYRRVLKDKTRNLARKIAGVDFSIGLKLFSQNHDQKKTIFEVGKTLFIRAGKNLFRNAYRGHQFMTTAGNGMFFKNYHDIAGGKFGFYGLIHIINNFTRGVLAPFGVMTLSTIFAAFVVPGIPLITWAFWVGCFVAAVAVLYLSTTVILKLKEKYTGVSNPDIDKNAIAVDQDRQLPVEDKERNKNAWRVAVLMLVGKFILNSIMVSTLAPAVATFIMAGPVGFVAGLGIITLLTMMFMLDAFVFFYFLQVMKSANDATNRGFMSLKSLKQIDKHMALLKKAFYQDVLPPQVHTTPAPDGTPRFRDYETQRENRYIDENNQVRVALQDERELAFAKHWNIMVNALADPQEPKLSPELAQRYSYKLAGLSPDDFYAGVIVGHPDLSVEPEQEMARERICAYLSQLLMQKPEQGVWEQGVTMYGLTPLLFEVLIHPADKKSNEEYEALNQKIDGTGGTVFTDFIRRHSRQYENLMVNLYDKKDDTGALYYDKRDLDALRDIKFGEDFNIFGLEYVIQEVNPWHRAENNIDVLNDRMYFFAELSRNARHAEDPAVRAFLTPENIATVKRRGIGNYPEYLQLKAFYSDGKLDNLTFFQSNEKNFDELMILNEAYPSLTYENLKRKEQLVKDVRMWFSMLGQPAVRMMKGMTGYDDINRFLAYANFPTKDTIPDALLLGHEDKVDLVSLEHTEKIDLLVRDRYVYMYGHQGFAEALYPDIYKNKTQFKGPGRNGLLQKRCLIVDMLDLVKEYDLTLTYMQKNQAVMTDNDKRYGMYGASANYKTVDQVDIRLVDPEDVLMTYYDDYGKPTGYIIRDKIILYPDGPVMYGKSGKPMNTNNIALFSLLETMQITDMNQSMEHEQLFLAQNALQMFRLNERLAILGLSEWVVSAENFLDAAVHAFGDRTFASMTQRFLTSIGTRFMYGHHDYIRGFMIFMIGLVIMPYVNEDTFAGQKAKLSGYLIDYIDFFRDGKARETNFRGVYGFNDKNANGGPQQAISRWLPRLLSSRMMGPLGGFPGNMLHAFGGVGFYLRKLLIPFFVTLYLALVVLAGVSPFVMFASDLVTGMFGIQLSQLITLPGWMQYILDKGFVRGTKEFIKLYPALVMGFAGILYPALFSGAAGVIKGEPDYVATGRLINSHKEKIFNPRIETDYAQKGNSKTGKGDLYKWLSGKPGEFFAVVGVVIAFSGFIFWPSLALLWTSLFVLIPLTAILSAPAFNAGAFPYRTDVAQWARNYFRDVINWFLRILVESGMKEPHLIKEDYQNRKKSKLGNFIGTHHETKYKWFSRQAFPYKLLRIGIIPAIITGLSINFFAVSLGLFLSVLAPLFGLYLLEQFYTAYREHGRSSYVRFVNVIVNGSIIFPFLLALSIPALFIRAFVKVMRFIKPGSFPSFAVAGEKIMSRNFDPEKILEKLKDKKTGRSVPIQVGIDKLRTIRGGFENKKRESQKEIPLKLHVPEINAMPRSAALSSFKSKLTASQSLGYEPPAVTAGPAELAADTDTFDGTDFNDADDATLGILEPDLLDEVYEGDETEYTEEDVADILPALLDIGSGGSDEEDDQLEAVLNQLESQPPEPAEVIVVRSPALDSDMTPLDITDPKSVALELAVKFVNNIPPEDRREKINQLKNARTIVMKKRIIMTVIGPEAEIPQSFDFETFMNNVDILAGTAGSSLGASPAGGIDMDNINVNIEGSSSSLLEIAPFDVDKFGGFIFKIVRLEKIKDPVSFLLAQK